MPDGSNHLVETILTLHHEVQRSIDEMEAVTRPNSGEVFLSIDKMNVKLPVLIDLDESILTLEDAEEAVSDMADRKGFLVDDRGDGTGLYTKIRLTTPSNVGDTDTSLLGYVEISFTPTER